MKRRYWILLTFLLLSALFVRGCVFRPATDYTGSHFNKGTNAIWLGIEWVNETHTPAEIEQLAHEMRERQITDIFVYVSYLKEHGEFNPTFDHAAEFITTFKSTYPEARILGWIGIPLIYVDLSDAGVRQKIVDFSASLIPLGFDGVQLDPESVIDHDPNTLLLLEETRVAIPNHILSISTHQIFLVYADEVPMPPLAKYLMWSADYYQQVADRVDQIAVMSYDSGLPFKTAYYQYIRFQVIEMTQALRDSDVALFIGIPTWEERSPLHHPRAENMENALKGVIRGLNDRDAYPERVTGLAFYAEWETSADEWATYKQLWLGE